MTNAPDDPHEQAALPPIVLMVEDDPDMLDMYSTYFESDGVWMATAVSPDEGLGAVEELRPDVVITDIGFGGQPDGVDFVHMLKERPETRNIPLIVLTGLPAADLPETMRHGADLFLRKPVPAQALLVNVRRLMESSGTLRARAANARVEAITSRCPACRGPLEWVERGSLEGREYDYYRPCPRGCGLYCFEPNARKWIKLT